MSSKSRPPTKKRRVYYASDESYRVTKAAAAILDESVTDFVSISIARRIDGDFTPEQQAILFHQRDAD